MKIAIPAKNLLESEVVSMLKTLFKKQFLEMNDWLFRDRKTGKKRSQAGIIGMGVLYLLLFVFLGSVFFMTAVGLCAPMCEMGLPWMYFVIMGVLSVAMGVFGSVFNTYASLYQAKDNQLLLSLPIPSRYILVIRLFGVWLWGTLYMALVYIPTLIVWFMQGQPNVLSVIFGILLFVLLSLFVLTLSCALGWVVALISAHIRNKSFVTVAVSLLFMGGYFYVYYQSAQLLSKLLDNAQIIAGHLDSSFNPLYLMGLAGTGRVLPMLILTVTVTALFALTCLILSRSFLHIATVNRGGSKKKYKGKASRQRSVMAALLSKERRRFTSSPVYMLNCGMGTILLPVMSVFVLIRASWLRDIAQQMLSGETGLLTLTACAVLCYLSTMNVITAPSVSLEGKNLWLVQALPISAWQVLRAKLALHLVVTCIPVLISSVCMLAALHLPVLSAVAVVVLPQLFVLVMAAFGLMLNLKMPNLEWTNETVPVKQSMGVMLSLFGGWGLVLVLGGLCFALHGILRYELLTLACALLLSGIAAGLLIWLKRRGSRIFACL